MTLTLRFAARSDRGLVRTNNEDSAYAGGRLLALADGMGGHAAGEVASQLVIAALAPLDRDEPGGMIIDGLVAAMEAGNSAIAEHVSLNPDLDGMGTTLTALLFDDARVGMLHVGDSRGYLLRDGVLVQITKDDTFVQTLVDDGHISAEEAHSHPQRSLIMKALTGHEVEPATTLREAKPGDRYLLCSDGLSDVVTAETIAEGLAIPDVDAAARRLIELALRSGGPDNITIVIAEVTADTLEATVPILVGAAAGEDVEYEPPPNTAASRAAAMRQRAAGQAPDEDVSAPRRFGTLRRWIVGLALLVLIALTIGYFVVRQQISSNFYIDESGGKVQIYQGVRASVFGSAFHSPHERICLPDDPGSAPLSFVSVDGAQECVQLRISDLNEVGRSAVSGGLPGKDLNGVRVQSQDLAQALLPLCTDVATPPKATPAPSASLTPSAGRPSPGTGPDRSGIASAPSSTPSPSAPSASGSAASGSAAPTSFASTSPGATSPATTSPVPATGSRPESTSPVPPTPPACREVHR